RLKNSFVIYNDFEEIIEELSDEQVGKLFKAIFKFEKENIEPIFEGELKIVFKVVKSFLVRNNEKYAKKCLKNKENGAKGGRPKIESERLNDKPKKSERLNDKPKKSERLNDKPKKPDSDSDSDSDSVIESGTDSKKKNNIIDFIKSLTLEYEKTLLDFYDMRIQKKRPLTKRAIELILKDFEKWKYSTEEIKECFENSIKNGWQGIFELKNKERKSMSMQEKVEKGFI
ncbi:MAG: DUF6291 domain-containing protein, partial [Fusobacteriaceae bacterium]